MARLCGLYIFSVSSPLQEIPLVSVHADFQVVDLTGQCTITQEYVNGNNHPIEAIYLFPMDEKASVCEFRADIGGKIIESVVKEKEEARREYNKAVLEGKAASLLEEKEADIFKVMVGNIPPNSSAIVQITYVTELSNHEDKVRVVLPTYVAPRYTPISQFGSINRFVDSVLFSSRNANTKTENPLSFRLECLMGSKVVDITSSTHQINSSTNNKSGVAHLNFNEPLNRDLVVDVRIAEAHRPRFMLETDEKEGITGMVSFVPEFHLDQFHGEFIFVIDRSGSMGGKKIEDAKEALQLFLRSLPSDCYFNIVSFGSTYSRFHSESVFYNDKSLKEATSHVNSMSADMGGTEIATPLKKVFSKNTIPGYNRQVFVITDGEVSNVSEVIHLVKNNSANSRVFSVGIGRNFSHALVNGIARAGKGTSEHVVEGQSIQPVVIRQLKNSMQPSLDDVTIEWGLPEAPEMEIDSDLNSRESKVGNLIGHRVSENQKLRIHTKNQNIHRQAPFNVPPIFSGTHFVVYAFFPPGVEPTVAKITAQTPDGPLSLTLQPEKTNFHGKQIRILAARALIRDLEEGSSYLHAGHLQPPFHQIRNEIVQLGTRFGLASKFTSFVGTEEPEEEPIPLSFNYGRSSRTRGGRGGRGGALPLADIRKRSLNLKSETYKAATMQTFAKKRKKTMKSPNLLSLVLLQKSDGSFKMRSKVAYQLGVSLDQMKEFATKNNLEEKVAATLLVLSFFTIKLSSKKPEWELVSAKCFKWLNQKGIEVQKFTSTADTFISQHSVIQKFKLPKHMNGMIDIIE